MRKIVCFGDSNTYGFSPYDGSRYGEDVRWTGVLDKLLGDRFEVINEGKNARTIAFDDPYNEDCNGMADIGPCIVAHEPFDLMIIMLGTNDLKAYFEATPQIIADNLRKMCEFIKEKTDTRLLLASPMWLGDQIEFSNLHLEFGRQQVEYSFELAPLIQKVAEQMGAEFIDLAVVAMSSDVDCLHLDPEEHDKLGKAMHAKVLDIFKEELAQEAREEEERRRKEEEEQAKLREEARQQAEAQKQEQERLQAEAAAQQAEREKLQAEAAVAAKQDEPGGMQFDVLAGLKPGAGQQDEPGEMQFDVLAGLKPDGAAKQDEPEGIQFDVLAGLQSGSVQQDESVSLLSGAGRLDEETVTLQEGTVRLQDESLSLLPEDGDLEEETRKIRMQAEAILRAAEEPVDVSGRDTNQKSTLLGGSFAPEGLSTGEKEKMLSGKLYRCDGELKAELARARDLTGLYNQTVSAEKARRQEILSELFEYMGEDCVIEPPFRCDYGRNILVGDHFYANFNCVMLDCGRIKIGSNVFLGPGVNIYTACHPIYAPVRNECLEYAKEVCIGDDVWIGGNVTVNPGVHIGNNVVIGSGSVVTGDIPDGVVAAGNPCRIIRRISESDKTYWEAKKAEREDGE